MLMIIQLLSVATVFATGDTGGTPYNAAIVKPPSVRSMAGDDKIPFIPMLSDAIQGDDDKIPFIPMLGYSDCGGAPLCGVLVLETGFGSGYYNHAAPVVHGLWTQDGRWGSSKCIAPLDSTPPQRVYPCYAANQNETPAQQLSFEQHEWKAHGVCAGVRDAEDFFGQVCDLSSRPLEIMAKARSAGARVLSAFETHLTDAGYHIDRLDSYRSQIWLSACAGSDGRWVLAKPSEFSERCGGSGDGSGSGQQLGAGNQLTTPAPSAEPMVAPVPAVSPMGRLFMELVRVGLGDQKCLETLVDNLARTSCAPLASVLLTVPCATDYVTPGFTSTAIMDACRYMGNAYFAKTMHDLRFPESSTLDVGDAK